MTQHLIKIIGGPFNGSRVAMPPEHLLADGRTVRMRGERYQLEFNEPIGALSTWEAHWLEPHGELDPEPWYVEEADEQGLGPESAAGRYSFDRVRPWDDRDTVSQLAMWRPRKGYEKEQRFYG